MKKVVTVLVAVALAGAVLYFSGTLLAVPGGLTALSVDEVDMTEDGDKWVVLVSVSGANEQIYTAFEPIDRSNVRDWKTDEKPDSLVTITLDNYKEYCTYKQGAKIEEVLSPDIVFHDTLTFPIEDVKEKCKKEVGGELDKDWIVIGGGGFFGLGANWVCVNLGRTPVYQQIVGTDIEATFGINYNGEKATATITQYDQTVNLKLPNGETVGEIEYVLAGLSLINYCSGKTPDLMTAGKLFITGPMITRLENKRRELDGCWGKVLRDERVDCVEQRVKEMEELIGQVQKEQITGGKWTTIEEEGKTLNQYNIPSETNVVVPTFKIILDTKWVGIYRPKAVSKVEWCKPEKEEVLSGEKLKVNYKVCNVGDGEAQFNIKTTCTGAFSKTSDLTPKVKAKSCVEHYTYVSAISGDDTQKGDCELEFSGPTRVEGEIPKDTCKFTATSIAATKCAPAGRRFCIGDILYECGEDEKERIKIEECDNCIENVTSGESYCKEKGPGDGNGDGDISIFWLIVAGVIVAAVMIIVYAVGKKKR